MTSTPIELELVAGGRPRLAQSLRELWSFRGTILAFAERDIRVKYKQAVLGVAWALLQPLAFLAIFTVFFGHVAKIAGDGVNYAAFALTALIPWNYVSTTVSFGANALLNDASGPHREPAAVRVDQVHANGHGPTPAFFRSRSRPIAIGSHRA